MFELPKDRSESGFDDFKPPYDKNQAIAEANRCLFCFDAPCIKACPTGIDIPGFIRKIATDNVKGSARTILESNILGTSCARVCPVEVLCVGDCVYNELGIPPIQIGKLQRYSTDQALEKRWTFFTAGPDTGKSVGIVGAGPAGLSCAHRLRRFGHRVTIYEKRPVLGGLNTIGVAPYKLRADAALAEVDYVLSIGGIEVRTGIEIPKDLSFEDLGKRHDALFLGFGLGPDTMLSSPAPEGVFGAVDWIERMKLGTVARPQRAIVLGGGNTAIDVVRELLGLGVADVTMVYRGTEGKMSGYAHEWSEAKDEGARVLWQLSPVGYDGSPHVTGVRVVSVDENKRAIAGTERVLPADLVLLAIGQSKLGQLVAGLPGVAVEHGRIVTDASGATGRPGVFSGGDGRNGGKEVVNAVAEGRDAAVAIDAYLGGR